MARYENIYDGFLPEKGRVRVGLLNEGTIVDRAVD